MVVQVNAVLLIHWFYMGDQVRHLCLETVMIIGSFVVFDKYSYEMTESCIVFPVQIGVSLCLIR